MAKFHDMCDRGRGQLSDRIQEGASGIASGAVSSSAATSSGGGMGIGGGAPGTDQPPLPEGWEQKQDGLKTVYVNAKLKARQETRPYCSRESLGQLLSAIDQIHNDTRSSSALSVLARSLGQKIVKPELSRKATVMLLGNGLGPQTFVETYTGQPLKHTGLGTTGYFTIVSKGASREIEKGDSALQRFHDPQRLRKIQGMDRSIAAEQVMSPQNRLAAHFSTASWFPPVTDDRSNVTPMTDNPALCNALELIECLLFWSTFNISSPCLNLIDRMSPLLVYSSIRRPSTTEILSHSSLSALQSSKVSQRLQTPPLHSKRSEDTLQAASRQSGKSTTSSLTRWIMPQILEILILMPSPQTKV